MKASDLFVKCLKEDVVKGGLFGVCVGDALGLPVQFRPRTDRENKPAIEMMGYGVFDMPPGTWSDDSSLTFCLAESLCNGYDLQDIADKFVMWLRDGYWTPFDKAFDVGETTRISVGALIKGVSPKDSGLKDENSNGNGSLMRILPLAFYLKDKKDIFKITHEVSAITHAHKRCLIACSAYVMMAINLMNGQKKYQAYESMKKAILQHYKDDQELIHFKQIFYGDISKLSINEINSKGYVIDTLEAALWCFLNNNTYKDIVLKAVNLGGDTDTTAAVAGGLAGIYYGADDIPAHWVEQITKKEDILKLAHVLSKSLEYSENSKAMGKELHGFVCPS